MAGYENNIMEALDELQEVILSGKQPSMFGVGKRVVSEDEVMGIIDDMRQLIPHEITLANQRTKAAEVRLQQVNIQADRIIAEAQSRAVEIGSQHEIARIAREQAAASKKAAISEASTIKVQADAYDAKTREQANMAARDIMNKATKQASDTVRKANAEATEIMTSSQQKATETIRKASAEAERILQEANENARHTNAEAEAALSAAQQAATKTLTSAQNDAAKVRTEAHEEAIDTIENARQEAAETVLTARHEAYDLMSSVDGIIAGVQDHLSKARAMSEELRNKSSEAVNQPIEALVREERELKAAAELAERIPVLDDEAEDAAADVPDEELEEAVLLDEEVPTPSKSEVEEFDFAAMVEMAEQEMAADTLDFSAMTEGVEEDA